MQKPKIQELRAEKKLGNQLITVDAVNCYSYLETQANNVIPVN